MPISVKLPDGRTIKVHADNAQDAAKAARLYIAHERAAKVRPKQTFGDEVARSATFGLADPISAGVTALAEQAPRLVGKDPGYSLGEGFTAARQVEKERSQDYNRDKPVRGLLGGLVGGLAAPGSAALGKFALGGNGLLSQVLRSAAVGGASGAVYGGATSDPGKLSEGVGSGAITGAVTGGVVPVAGRVATAAANSAPVRTVARAANRATGGKLLNATSEASKRLVEALKKDGADPQTVATVMNTWLKSGASAPALLDVASKLPSGGQYTISLLRGAALKAGPARGAAMKYSDEQEGALLDRAINRTGQLTPDTRTVPEVESGIQQRITQATQAPDFQQGQGGAAVSDAVRSRAEQARQAVSQAYSTARNSGPAHLAMSEKPTIAANLREAIADFHPTAAPSTNAILRDFDNLGTLTLDDLQAVRTRASNLRAGPPTPESVAAGNLVRAVDAQIDDVAQRGALTGDPEAVDNWRKAIAARREFGRQFEGDDIISTLAEQTRRGGGVTNALSPEDASNALLGRNGVAPRQDANRDLARLRDMLGADSPEWLALQREASGRLQGLDAGTERFGHAAQKFQRQNPELSRTLIPEEDFQRIAQSQQEVLGAQGDQRALGLGQEIASSAPDRFAANLDTSRLDLSQLGGARQLQDQIGRMKGGAVGGLNTLSTAPNLKRNLTSLYGDEEADLYQEALKNEVSRVSNARSIDPNYNSRTAMNLEDAGSQPLQRPSLTNLITGAIDKIRRGATLTDEEREIIIRLGTQQADPQLLRQPAPRQAISPAFALPSALAIQQ